MRGFCILLAFAWSQCASATTKHDTRVSAETHTHAKHAATSAEGEELDPLCNYTTVAIPKRFCQSAPSCSSLTDGSTAATYLELLRRSLIGATAPFSQVPLLQSLHYSKSTSRRVGVLINSGYLRMRNLQCLLQDVRDSGVPGELVETGIWRGGAVIFMAGFVQAHSQTRRVWGFDSFMGVPSVHSGLRGPLDKNWEHNETSSLFDGLSVPQSWVQAHIDNYALGEHVRLVPGWFKDSIPPQTSALAARGGIALLRIDGDLYSSTMQALSMLYPLLNPGGWIVLDDWNVPQARQAVHAYRQEMGITEPISYHSGHPMTYPVARWRKAR